MADPAVQFWWVANHGGAANLPAAAPEAGWWSYVDPIAPTLSFLAPPGWRVTARFVRADLRAVVAPEAEFTAVTQTVFLPVAMQLLLPADGDRDRDGDGVTNDADAFPDDPQRR